MNVSGAYAWTKGNHIDDQISKIGKDIDVQFKIEKAGYTWEYLQFTVKQNAEDYMLIVKNARRVVKSFSRNMHKPNEDNYLVGLAKDINTPIFKNRTRNFVDKPEQIQLELNAPAEVNAVIEGTQLSVEHNYSRFYIVIYEIDDQTKLINSVQLTMPNAQTMNLELIEDLSYLIQESEYEVSPEDVEPIINEKVSNQTTFSGTANAFGYSVPEEEAEENSGN